MEQTKITTVGSVIAATIASLCCIGPVVVALLGVGSLSAFAMFEAYRLYLIGATILLLGLAFYLTYRKQEVICEDGTCKIERGSKWNKISVWVATALAVVTIAFPYFRLNPSYATELIQTSLSVTHLKIEGMYCKGCALGLEATLLRVKGVQRATVNYEKASAIVEYDPKLTDPAKLTQSVNETGYKAELILPSNQQNHFLSRGKEQKKNEERKMPRKLQHIFDAELKYQDELEVIPFAGHKKGDHIGNGGGRVWGEKINGTIRWSYFAENCAYLLVKSGQQPAAGQHLCRSGPIGIIETNDGAQIRFDAEGFGLRGYNSSNPHEWTLTHSLQFHTDDKRYLWLNSTLGLWQGHFDESTKTGVYTAFIQTDE